MTGKTVVAGILSVIACLGLVIAHAHAGAGMGAGLGVTTCRFIASGAPNQPQSIAMVDQFVLDNDLPDAATPGDVVKVNAAVLVCDLAATGVTVDGGGTGNPVLPGNSTSTTCYAVTGADPTKFNVTVQDTFTAAATTSVVQNVVLGAIQLVCVPSVTTPVTP